MPRTKKHLAKKSRNFQINYLARGMESPKKIDLLLSVTRITRPELISALKDYYCEGCSKVDAASFNGVKSQNLSSPIQKLNEVAEAFEKYIELKTNELNSSKLTKEQQIEAKSKIKYKKEYLE
ncbi:MAG: hypothetical protein ACPGTQ_15740 [Colwellia sp.]